jgi:hypothetical protein
VDRVLVAARVDFGLGGFGVDGSGGLPQWIGCPSRSREGGYQSEFWPLRTRHKVKYICATYCPARRRSSCRRPSAHLMVFVESSASCGWSTVVPTRVTSLASTTCVMAQRCACERVPGSGVGSSGNDATARKGYEQCVRSWSDDKNFALPGLRSAVFYFPCRQESTWAGEGYHPPW